jgi:hypothetical protein
METIILSIALLAFAIAGIAIKIVMKKMEGFLARFCRIYQNRM